MSGAEVVSDMGPNIGISGTNALDTGIKKWGSSSLKINPSQPVTTMPSNIDMTGLDGMAWQWQFWAYWTAGPNSKVLDFRDNGSVPGIQIGRDDASSGKYIVTVASSSGGAGGTGSMSNNAGVVAPANTWVHVCIEFRPTMGLRVFDSSNPTGLGRLLSDSTTKFNSDAFRKLLLVQDPTDVYYIDSTEFRVIPPEREYLLYQVKGYTEPTGPFPSGNAGSWPSNWTPSRLRWTRNVSNESELTLVSGKVQYWRDVTKGDSWYQDSSSPRPVPVANAQNGLPAVQFDGTDDFLYVLNGSDGFKNVNYGAFFIVFKKTALDGSPTARPLFFANTSASGTTRFGLEAGHSGAANQLRLVTRRLDADSAALLTGPTLVDTNYHMVLAVMDWSTATGHIYLDGDAPTSASMGTSGATSNTSNFVGPRLGRDTGTNYGDFIIGEALNYSDTALSAGDIDKLFGYAAHKWGLTANLPGGHPYKTVAP
jgi:hypothetical protein